MRSCNTYAARGGDDDDDDGQGARAFQEERLVDRGIEGLTSRPRGERLAGAWPKLAELKVDTPREANAGVPWIFGVGQAIGPLPLPLPRFLLCAPAPPAPLPLWPSWLKASAWERHHWPALSCEQNRQVWLACA